MKRKIFALVLLLAAATLYADCRPFRSGVVLCAELSAVPQKIADFDAEDYPEIPQQNQIYAAVTINLFQGRQLSRHDYSIRAFGRDYKCAAIKVDDGPWKSNSGDITLAENKRKYTMLFILDNSVVGHAAREEMDLKCNYPPVKYSETPLIFNNCGKKNFTPAKKIPQTGILSLKK